MELTKQEHDYLWSIISQTYAFADNHENADERKKMALALLRKLDENLIEYGYADQVGETEDE
jgi:hypothetical protein